MAVPTRLRNDDGFLLVEVLVSAMLLVAASLAIMTALDKSDALAGNQQRRTVAANVAQAEMERVRSLPIEDVANLRSGGSGQRSQTLNGTTFTINTSTRWLTDGKDTVDCTANGGGLDYLQVTTQVTWPGMGNAKPTKLTTLLAPSNRSTSDGNGSLSVSVANAQGNGLASLPVTLTGPTSYTDATDANGCVAWGDLDASAGWVLKFKLQGYVDQNGNADVNDNIALAGGTTTTRQYLYDKAGYIKAMFRTRPTANGPDVLANSEDLQIANAEMSSTKTQTFPATNTWDGAAATVPLFPFTSSPYTVYAGQCAAAKPPAGNNPQAPSYVNVSGAQTQGVLVWLPSLKVTVKNSSYVGQQGATVKVTDACGNTYERTTGPGGELSDEDSAFPYFASGTVCASYNNYKVTSSVSNTSLNGATHKTLTIPTSWWSRGSC